VAQLWSLGILALAMNLIPQIKRRWWRILVFTQEAYLALAGLTFFALAVARGDPNAPTAIYMFWGYLAAIVGSLISGIILIVFGKRKLGLTALAFAMGAIVWLILLLPMLAAEQRRA
jgi:hypothetical protein